MSAPATSVQDPVNVAASNKSRYVGGGSFYMNEKSSFVISFRYPISGHNQPPQPPNILTLPSTQNMSNGAWIDPAAVNIMSYI